MKHASKRDGTRPPSRRKRTGRRALLAGVPLVAAAGVLQAADAADDQEDVPLEPVRAAGHTRICTVCIDKVNLQRTLATGSCSLLAFIHTINNIHPCQSVSPINLHALCCCVPSRLSYAAFRSDTLPCIASDSVMPRYFAPHESPRSRLQ